MIIAIDFDGTCVEFRYPKIGPSIGAAPVLRRLVDAGHSLILNTMREGEELEQAAEWFRERGIKLCGTNQGMNTKMFAHLYIDDSALGCPLKNDSARPYVDWEEVERLLVERGFLERKK